MTTRSMFGPGNDYAGKPGPQGGDQPGCVGVALLAMLAIVAVLGAMAVML
jgi:hypothetical protein